jgi:hypothetical protein
MIGAIITASNSNDEKPRFTAFAAMPFIPPPVAPSYAAAPSAAMKTPG